MECAASVRITQWVRGCYEVVVTAVGWPFSTGEVTRCVFLEEPVKESGIINSMDKAAVALPPIREGGTCRTILSRTQSQRSRCEASAVVVGLYECSPFRFNTLGCIVQVWSIHKRRGSRVHFSFCTVPCTVTQTYISCMRNRAGGAAYESPPRTLTMYAFTVLGPHRSCGGLRSAPFYSLTC